MSLIAAEIAAYSSEQGREYFFCNIPNCAKCLFCAKRNGSTSEFERSSQSDVLTIARFGGKIAELHKIFILRRFFLPPLSAPTMSGHFFCFYLFCAPLGGTGGGTSLVLFLRGGGRGLATEKKHGLPFFVSESVIKRSTSRFVRDPSISNREASSGRRAHKTESAKATDQRKQRRACGGRANFRAIFPTMA